MSDLTAWAVAGLTRREWVRHALDIRIRIAAGPYLDSWDYSIEWGKAKVLYDLPDAMGAEGVEWKAGDGRLTNCSTLTASLLTSVYPDAPWTMREYGDLQVFKDRLDAGQTDSPIRAVERMGIGKRVDKPTEGKWHLVQGWRSLDPPRGHAFLVLAFDDVNLQVLEATSRRSIGPRYKTTTLAELQREYSKALHWAALSKD
jgi:hypothetical protein